MCVCVCEFNFLYVRITFMLIRVCEHFFSFLTHAWMLLQVAVKKRKWSYATTKKYGKPTYMYSNEKLPEIY